MSWRDQISALRIPVPRRWELAREIESHLEHFPEERDQLLEPEALIEFYEVHNNALYRWLYRLPARVRTLVETGFAAAPLVALLIFLKEEKFMFEFIREGGACMFLVLALGGFFLVRELIGAFRIFVSKDHSAVQMDSIGTILGAMSVMLMGICGTALGAYASATYAGTQVDKVHMLILGLKESVTCLIVASCFAGLILLTHYFSRVAVRGWCGKNATGDTTASC